jgi:hypothetical protein
MRLPTAIRCLPAALALALLCLPAPATAAPLDFPFHLPASVPAQLRAQVRNQMNPGHAPAPSHPEFILKASNGYLVGVIGVATGVVALEVARHHASAATVYVARGTATSRRLEASFGSLGKVAMRFQPSPSPVGRSRQVCRGDSGSLDRRGVYVGGFRFTGEGGYVSVQAHRVKGDVSTPSPVCTRSRSVRRPKRATGPERHHEQPPAILLASWRHAVDSAEFAVIGIGEDTLFFATTAQSEGRLAVLRLAIAGAKRKTFTVDDALTSAQVSPPAPFDGTGTYTAAPDGTTTWTGSLSVNFPGAEHFPMVGPQFKAFVGTAF